MNIRNLWKWLQAARTDAKYFYTFDLSLLALIVMFIVGCLVLAVVLVFFAGISLVRWWQTDTSCDQTPPHLRFQLGEVLFEVPSHYQLGWSLNKQDGGYSLANTKEIGRVDRDYRTVCQAQDAPPFGVRRLRIAGPFHATPSDDPIHRIGNSDVSLYMQHPSSKPCPADGSTPPGSCPWQYGLALGWSKVANRETETVVPRAVRDHQIEVFLKSLVVSFPPDGGDKDTN